MWMQVEQMTIWTNSIHNERVATVFDKAEDVGN